MPNKHNAKVESTREGFYVSCPPCGYLSIYYSTMAEAVRDLNNHVKS